VTVSANDPIGVRNVIDLEQPWFLKNIRFVFAIPSSTFKISSTVVCVESLFVMDGPIRPIHI